MKKRFALMTLVAIVVLPLLAAGPEKRDAQWKAVDEETKKGLPKSAIQRLNPIIEGAMHDKAYAEAIKAIARKIALEGIIQGNKPEEKIARLEAEIAKAPAEMAPVMNAILADWYWHYFQQNRWRFVQRTATSVAPGKDITTWDLPRILAEIDKQFSKSLAGEAELKKVPIAQYDDLLQKGTMPDKYRPTLFDFLAHQALGFYLAAEQAGAQAEDAFELSAESPIFASVEEFVKWEVGSKGDEQSPTVSAIRLYQKLLQFHAADADQTAFLDVDLDRLSLGHNKAFGEEKNARYKAALKRFVEHWGDHEVSAYARYLWASALQQEGALVEAHALAQQGARAFAQSPGGQLCHNLVEQIEAPAASITTERVWNEPAPTIQVHYRNVTQVYFRAVRADWAARLKTGHQAPEFLNHNQHAALLAEKPEREWSAKLPATEDFQERIEEVPAPQDLKPGFYFLVSSHDPKFNEHNNQVSFTAVWVSKLALVMRTRWGEGRVEGFVLDAVSGEPVAGADVQLWVMQNWASYAPGPAGKTDANGLFALSTGVGNYLIHVGFKDQQLATANQFYNYRQNRNQDVSKQTIFFTDRSLYRPGQTIQYKGICIRADREGDNYQTLPNTSLTVVFADANGKEVARQKVQSNDYGSISGSFTAPRDRLMGQMTLRVENGPLGNAVFHVEEYKRPKFQTVLEAPKAAPKLGEKAILDGKATAYTGAAIDGGRVRYRVVREVRYPAWWFWCYWWLGAPQGASQEIAHGTALTQTDGSFKVEFVAKPDPSVAEKDEPVFHFTVYTDVTDTAGETRSAERSINVGYAALQAALSAADWLTNQQPVEISISTQTLDGDGQVAEGSLKVYKLKEPAKVERATLDGQHFARPRATVARRGKAASKKPIHGPQPAPDMSNPNSWELGEKIDDRGFTSNGAGKASVSVKLQPGAYRALLETQDRFGRKVTAMLPLLVLDPAAGKLNVKVPNLVSSPKWTLEPGEEFTALWGSGYDRARAFLEIENRGKSLKAFWTESGATQQSIKQAVTEALRGGFTLHVTMVRENRAYLTSHRVEVPWTNKQLTLKWEHFTSKLQPAQKETWTAVITGPDAKKAVAEMVAALYDQSLDAYLPHNWAAGFGVFRQDYSTLQLQFENAVIHFQHGYGNWPSNYKNVQISYRAFPNEIIANLWGYMYNMGRMRGLGYAQDEATFGAPTAPMAAGAAGGANGMEFAKGDQMEQLQLRDSDKAADGAAGDRRALTLNALAVEKKAAKPGQAGQGPAALGAILGQVSARTNLQETAFFFPHLVSGEDGTVRLEFTMPEALTQWKFLGFAHDRNLRGGLLEDHVVTAKDLMVQPNPPRFLREGDVLEFTVKVSNQSPTRQTGTVRLSFTDGSTAKTLDAALGNTSTDQSFEIPSKESRTFSWRLTVPDLGGTALAYKAVASTGRLSDGEEGFLPVLARRILVTESLPLPIRGPQTKQFEFTKLLKSGESKTLRNQTLTVEMVSNPSWYAVMALPYLMEFPHECTEQTFNRLYANALARHIAASDPKIRRIFDLWKGTPALESPLEKNQDLKAVMLEETPWVRQAQAESQARRNVGILFDENRLNEETKRLLQKLSEQQFADGAWPWFPGGPPCDYITLYITTGFGRLRHLSASVDIAPALKSLARLDAWIDKTYREILEQGHKDDIHLSSTIALYLYGRSFFLKDKPLAAAHKEAVDYFLGQAKTHWLKLADRQSQAHLAVALTRFGDRAAAQDIMRSIKERSVSSEEMGMFWRDLELSWWWYHAPIETQAMMIEAFDEVMDDAKAVEECKVWLLKQKQTQDWKTSKATADAVYALLLRGDNTLASDLLVEVSLAGTAIKPEKVEAGTGYYEQRFVRGEIKPEMGQITVKKLDKGVAWGSMHWQYLEDMTKVTPYEGTPLKLTKQLYTRQLTKKGPVLEPVAGALKVGDELVVRLVLRVDRDMEFIHLEDQRGSGTEPVNVLSHYKYQDGLGYYESTRDTASHFFIDYLPKGTYVFEYATRVVHKGVYQSGMAAIQCMYAPEFNSHSESFTITAQ